MTPMAFATNHARLRRVALLSATMLATGLNRPAEAAMYGIVVNQVSDPLLANLSIPATAPTQGMFAPVQNWPMNAITLALLPSGNVVSYGTAANNPSVQDGRTFDIWDPTAGLGGGHVTLPGVVGVNSFCAAQSFQADGSLLISGGIFDNGNDKGSVVLNNQGTAVTALSAKFANDRYYSTMINLPDGRQLIMGGSYPYLGGFSDPQGSIDKGYMTGMTPEIYAGGQWSSLFGANSRDAFGPDNSRWWYPRAWVAPNGKVFGISADKMWMMSTTGQGSITTWNFKQPQRNASSATDAPNVGPVSTAVMYDTGKILQVGGNSYTNGDGFLSSSLATTIDITSGTPVLADTAPMNFGRAWAQSTVLPTGQVAVTGGSKYNDQAGDNSVLRSETWDPKTGKWSLGASGSVYRGYHSAAILMQNGALLIAGGGAPGPVNNQNAEVYYPPYLFTATGGTAALAPRPSIVSLGTLAPNYAQTLQFELSSKNGLSQVVLIGLSAATHSFNSGQRRYVASFTQSGQSVSVQMPGSSSTLPPGYYQLVAIDTQGVPSPGVIIGFGGASAPVQARTLVAATGTAGNGSGGATGGTGTGSGTGGGGSTGTVPGWPASTASWNQIGVTVTRIAIASDGTLLGINSNDKSIWLNGANGGWNKLPGTAIDIAAVNSGSIYSVAQDGSIYRYTNGGQSWSQVGRRGLTISAAADGTVATLNASNEIWVKIADNNEEAWYQVPGRAKRVAVMNSNSFYIIGMDDNVYRSDKTGNWAMVGRDASDIAASADGSVMVINKYAGTLWRKIGDNTTEAWTQQPANQPAAAVAIPNAQRAVMVGKDTNIYRW